MKCVVIIPPVYINVWMVLIKLCFRCTVFLPFRIMYTAVFICEVLRKLVLEFDVHIGK